MRFRDLLEYNRKNSAKIRSKILIAIAPDSDPEETLKVIEKGDPTKNKRYIPWIISQIGNNFNLLKHMIQMRELLRLYEYYKPRLPEEQQDIYKLNYQQVFDIIDKIDNPEVDFENTKEIDLNINGVNQNEYSVIYDGPLGRLVVPKTKNAACVLGHGTKWCTAATSSNNAFSDYAEQGNLYYWRDKTGKYAFHFENLEFVDEQNINIDWDILKNWHNHRVLKQMFKVGEKRLGVNILNNSLNDTHILNYFVNYVLNVMYERLAKRPENIFLNHVYIDHVMKYVTKYPESANIAENAVLNREWLYDAFTYNKILRKNERWPELEKIMLNKQAEYDISANMIEYVKTIIKERWPEIEQVLLRLIEKRLARNKGIAGLIHSTAIYAKDILGIKLSQWKEFMNILKKHDYELPDKFRQ